MSLLLVIIPPPPTFSSLGNYIFFFATTSFALFRILVGAAAQRTQYKTNLLQLCQDDSGRRKREREIGKESARENDRACEHKADQNFVCLCVCVCVCAASLALAFVLLALLLHFLAHCLCVV